ncbi:MAG: tRNA (adenosine(37)-N6)-threonylcarbamoyltransferase complex dimerization subunit type 1 TsaB [Solirubrobacteraceae bacterium]
MIVLGFDTATPATAVALRLADGRTTQARDDPPAGAHPGHATRLLEMARELLAGAGVAWSGIDRVAVGVGPGTFTGLRVGVATARGLAQSLSAELVGVSSPRALAVAALAAEPARAGEPLAVLAVIDARRGEAFAAAYEAGDTGVPRELAAPRALAPQELASVLAHAQEALDGRRRWLAVGDGAVRFREQLEAGGVPTPPDSSALHQVSAAAVCELGAQAAAASLHELVPDYCRRPDAELALVGGVEAS